MVYKSHEQLADKVRSDSAGPRIVGVIAADDDHTLEAVLAGVKAQIITPKLYGSKNGITEKLKIKDVNPADFEIIDVETPEDCAFQAGIAAKEGRVHFLMKGGISSGKMMRALFNKETGFRVGNLISHMALGAIPNYHKLLAITDSAITVYPTLEQKAGLIKNAVATLTNMGFDTPKVAVLAAAEDVDPKITETVEARALQEMYEKAEITNCIVEGPLSLDLSVDVKSAEAKNFSSKIAGDADLLVCPNIAAGNILLKSLRCFAKTRIAGLVVGGRVPLTLTSRGGSSDEKFLPLVLAAAATN